MVTQWSSVSFSRTSRFRVHEEEPGKIHPPCRMIKTQPMGVIMLLGSKVLSISWALRGDICVPDPELVVDAPQASTHIADPPHSAVGVGCDPSEE